MLSRTITANQNLDEKFATGDVREPVYRGYDTKGGEVSPDDPDAVAKSCEDPVSGNVRYWVRRAVSGESAGRLYDPYSAYLRPGETPSRAFIRNGNAAYVWRPATKECFEQYLVYLRGSPPNPLHLRYAERL